MSKKEYKIGERIVLDVVENDTVTCTGCYFDNGKSACQMWKKYPCIKTRRKDRKNVIYKEVKE